MPPTTLASARSRRAKRLCALIVAAGVIATACGSDDSESAATATAAPYVENDVAALIAEASPAQQPYLEDGVVTAAERETAFLDFLDCMEAEGLVTTDYNMRPDGGETVQQDNGDLTADEIDQITNTCRTDRYVIVGAVYTAQNGRTDEEERAVLDQAADCMRDSGLEVPGGATLNQLSEIDREISTDCYAAAEGR